MRKDIRRTALYEEAEGIYKTLRQPGAGLISDAAEVHASPAAEHAVFAGTIVDKLEGSPLTRICQVHLASGDVRVLTFGPNTDRLPKYSPDGRHVAFLSDRCGAGDFQLFLLDLSNGAAWPAPRVEGWVEYLHWSPDGRQILLGVAGHGADIAGGQGAISTKQVSDSAPSWMPAVEGREEGFRWRRAWVYELATGCVRQISSADSNIWEAVWCGNESVAAVVSPGAGEGLWYSASLRLIDVRGGNSHEVYKPQSQLGWPAASPSGRRLAIVEAVCSDRWLVAGELLVTESLSGEFQKVHTKGVDVTYTEWRSDRHLLVAGHRAFESVVGIYDAESGTFTEAWHSRDVTSAGIYISVSGISSTADWVLVGEGFLRAPEIALISRGEYRTVRSFDLGYAEHIKPIAAVDCVTWVAPDRLEIQGWLLRPTGEGPFPLVVNVHGGPVWHWHPTWLGRRSAVVLMLLKRGYAAFFPNPRGSSGRGQEYARHVLGDIGGADTYDFLSGIDHLVDQEIADPKRLGVTGVSYGGFMTSWLITQDSRFAAAVPVAPVSNQVTGHLISNIPHFVSLFLADTYTNAGGKYYTRSPIMYAHKVKTPTLNICGALDRCTPPEEAVQFHNGLLESGVESVLVTYPEEGHGIRKFPATIDYAARVVAWFEDHMAVPPKPT